MDSKVVARSDFSPAPNVFPSPRVLICGSQTRVAEQRKWPLGEKVSHWRGKMVMGQVHSGTWGEFKLDSSGEKEEVGP